MKGLELSKNTASDLSNVVKEGLEKAAKAGVFGYDELAINHACFSELTNRARAMEKPQTNQVLASGLVCEPGHPCWNPLTGKCDDSPCVGFESGAELMKIVLSKTEKEQLEYFNAIFDKLKPK